MRGGIDQERDEALLRLDVTSFFFRSTVGLETAALQRAAFLLGGAKPTMKHDPDALARCAAEYWLRVVGDSPCVYFIRAGVSGPIKIGYAAELASRLSSIQTGNHEPLFVLAVVVDGTRSLESELHARFDRAWLRGEWFHPLPELLSFVEAIQALHGGADGSA